MKLTATLRIKLTLSPQAEAALEATQVAYVAAQNQISEVAFRSKTKNPVELHHLCYYDVRAATKLPANLTVAALRVVAEQYERELTPNKPHHWRDETSVRYDACTLSFDFLRKEATLSTLKKNCRVQVGLVLSAYHQRFFDGSWSMAETATLVHTRKRWFLHFVATKEVPESEGKKILTSDAGIVRASTTNTGLVHKGGSILRIRKERAYERDRLQAGHKSRGKRRLLTRLAGREHRAVEWFLWNIANDLVREAIRIGAGVIVLENLTGIRERIKVAKQLRYLRHSWPFASLQKKIEHVAARHGIRVEKVSAAYTSQTCRCGHVSKANRVTQSLFRCETCGYRHNADLVASHNLARRYVAEREAVCKPAQTARQQHRQGKSLAL